MLGLLRKEWREHRLLIWGFLLLAPALSFGLKQFVVTWHKVTPAQSLEWLVPGMMFLYFVGIAADLVAGDAGSGRSAFVAALPVRTRTVWLAKLSFLLGTAILYFAWLLIMEGGILLAADIYPLKVFEEVPTRKWLPLLGLAALCGVATLFFSTLMDRGLAAAFLAIVVLAGIGFLLLALKETFRFFPRDTLFAFGALLGVAFVGGSFAAFVFGRVHLGSRLRRNVLAFATFLPLVLIPTGYATASLSAWYDFDPTDEFAVHSVSVVDAAGDWAVVRTRKRGSGLFGAGAPWGWFAVRLGDGTVRDLTDYGWPMHGKLAMPSPGCASVWRSERIPGEKHKVLYLNTIYDLDADRPVRTITVSERNTPLGRHLEGPYGFRWQPGCILIHRPKGKVVRLKGGWNGGTGHAPWGVAVFRNRRIQTGIYRFDTRELVLVPGRGHFSHLLLPAQPDGMAIGVRGSSIVRFAIGGDGVEVVARGRQRGGATTPDGRRCAALLGDTLWLLTAEDASARAVAKFTENCSRVVISADGTHAALTLTSRHVLLDLASGKTSVLERTGGRDTVAWTDGDRVLLCDHETLRLGDREGNVRPVVSLEVER